MKKILEENILMESNFYSYYYNIDHINNLICVDIYNKNTKKYILEEHPLKWDLKDTLKNNLPRKQGEIIQKAGRKLILRNHDIVVYSDELGCAYCVSSKEKALDTRFQGEEPLLSKARNTIKKLVVGI